VILAFSGAKGEPYESIRERGFHISIGEREPDVSSVAAPVFSTNWRLLGSICISGPSSRLTKARLEKHAKVVMRAANQLSYALAGSRSAATPKALSRWHP
jgi:DNA-binding IclR family transcriptional regulator